jgi:hypothetical protein
LSTRLEAIFSVETRTKKTFSVNDRQQVLAATGKRLGGSRLALTLLRAASRIPGRPTTGRTTNPAAKLLNSDSALLSVGAARLLDESHELRIRRQGERLLFRARGVLDRHEWTALQS